jgi:CRP-like cAMP-binding protein
MQHLLEEPSHFLRGFERLLGELAAAEREHLGRLEAGGRRIAARQKLIDRGQNGGRAYLLQSGWLMEYRGLRDGGRQILNFRLPGEVVGLEGVAYAAALHSVATLTECLIVDLELAAFEELQRSFARLATTLFVQTLREEAILHEWEASLGRRSASARIAHLLLELQRRLELRGLCEGNAFDFPVTQADLADCVGITPPYANRILRTMQQSGLIRIRGRRLALLDLEGLVEAAGFERAYLEAR